MHDDDLLAELRGIDTPTVCNALELLVPERRGSGFTVRSLVCVRPGLSPIAGYARTATIRAAHPPERPEDQATVADAYYAYVDAGPKPSVVVIQDLDGERRATGSFWGEVNSAIHLGLGALGVITDGSVRDLPDIADGFQLLADRVGPSHAFVHVVGFGDPVEVAGMRVEDGDLVHADQHGAVVIPHEVAGDVRAAAASIAAREAVVVRAAQQPGFDVERLRDARRRAAELGP